MNDPNQSKHDRVDCNANHDTDRPREISQTESLLRSFRPRPPRQAITRAIANIGVNDGLDLSPSQPQPILTTSPSTTSTRFAMAFIATFAGGAITGALCVSLWMQSSQPGNVVDLPAMTSSETQSSVVETSNGTKTQSDDAGATNQTTPNSSVLEASSLALIRDYNSATQLTNVLSDATFRWPGPPAGTSHQLVAGSLLGGRGIVHETPVKFSVSTSTPLTAGTDMSPTVQRLTPASRPTHREILRQLLNPSQHVL